MQLSAARIMNGSSGGGVVMESPETAHGVRRAGRPGPGNERGHHPVTAAGESLRRDRIIHSKEAPHPVSARCGSLG